MYHVETSFPLNGQVDIRVAAGFSKTGQSEFETKVEAQDRAKFLARGALVYGYCVALELDGLEGNIHWFEPVSSEDEGFYSSIIGMHVACLLIGEMEGNI